MRDLNKIEILGVLVLTVKNGIGKYEEGKEQEQVSFCTVGTVISLTAGKEHLRLGQFDMDAVSLVDGCRVLLDGTSQQSIFVFTISFQSNQIRISFAFCLTCCLIEGKNYGRKASQIFVFLQY